MRKKLELLAPAASLTGLKAVIHAGADAVYFGGPRFGARAYAKNLKKEEVLEAIDFGHIHERKIIMAVNTLLKEQEMEEELYEYLLPFYEQGLDAVIVQDFGMFSFLKQHFPGLPIHASTQMTVAGTFGADLLAKQGAGRIVLSRELSLAEIKKIHEAVPVELESFVHGALCYSYSGQCLFSSILGGRSGNRGRCAQPCRLPYECYDENFHKISPGHSFYPLSLKDLCTIERIPQFAEAGVYSFKIEGRMKQPEYAAGVVSVYRKYMDIYLNYGKQEYKVRKEDVKKLFDLGNRSGFTEGYYNCRNGKEMLASAKPSHTKSNAVLQKDIRETYIDKEIKEKINGTFVFQKEKPAALTLQKGKVSVTKKGDIPAAAQKQPLTEEVLSDRLQKTGGTPFVFGHLAMEAEDGLFLAVSRINELRRSALGELEKALTEPYRRYDAHPGSSPEEKLNHKNITGEQGISLRVSLEDVHQFDSAVKFQEIDRIYLDSAALKRDNLVEEVNRLYEKAKKSGKEFYYILPAVFRFSTAEFYGKILPELNADGFLAKSYDALGFLLENHISPGRIVTDASLYAFSNRTGRSFSDLGTGGDTIPLELNGKELLSRSNENSEMIVYGYLPVMTCAQCIRKNVGKCDRRESLCYLKDRYGICFPVKNHCSECYNTIYNSRPLELYPLAEELKRHNITKFRMQFTIETAEEAGEILREWCHGVRNRFPSGAFREKDITYGHYKRGVE